jgi:hypothetical protein
VSLVCLTSVKLIVFNCSAILQKEKGSEVSFLKTVDLSGFGSDFTSVFSATTTLGLTQNSGIGFGETNVLVTSTTKILKVRVN